MLSNCIQQNFKMFTNKNLVQYFFVFFSLSLIAVQALQCPPEELLKDCKCDPDVLQVNCIGPKVTQTILDNFLQNLQTINHGIVNLTFFVIQQTTLTQLDLSLFINMHIDNLILNHNPILSKLFVDSESDPSKCDVEDSKIDMETLDLSHNNLTDQQITILGCLGSRLTSLDLSWNKFHGGEYPLIGSPGDVQFLPGLSSLTKLKFLLLNGNSIQVVQGGQFKRNRNLQVLSLSEMVEMGMTIGVDAFLLDGPEEPDSLLRVYLNNDGLTDESFISNFKSNRTTFLSFQDNHFEFISEGKFDSFLNADAQNLLYFGFNLNFICDDRMKWLKDQKDEMEGRVIGIYCSNDPTQTVFTTSLIS